MLPLPVPQSRGSSASPPGTDSGGRGGGGRLHSSPAGRCCARTGDRRLPGTRGAGMELFQAKDHYILQQGERALWCSRHDGGLQLRPGEALGAGWVGRAGQLERGVGGRGSGPPGAATGRLGGPLGNVSSGPEGRGRLLGAHSCLYAAGKAGHPPFSVPPPVSGAWGVGTGSLRPPPAPASRRPARESSGFEFHVVQWKPWRDSPC